MLIPTPTTALRILVLVLAGMLAPIFPAFAAGEVVPIRWSAFPAQTPRDADSLRVRNILLNANRYALTTWWRLKGFQRQSGTYLSFGGTEERHIRPAASEAAALAISLKTRAYDARKTGVSAVIAKQRALRLIRSLAYRHRTNSPDGWGENWQSALWASSAGFAGWLLWDDLSPTDQRYVQRMVEREANRFKDYRAPYYSNLLGKVVSPGDSKAEENAWNGRILQLATAMMPEHPRRGLWQEKMIELMLSAFARPVDTASTRQIHGRTLAEWLRGANVRPDGSIVNHGRVHPDYFASVTDNVHGALVYTLAGLPIPQAALFNADVVYGALVNRQFAGGTIYREGSGDIYYPEGTLWGARRQMHFALFDLQAQTFGLDRKARRNGAYWEPLHTQAVLSMQQRSKDGRTYKTLEEDAYAGREEWVADLAAQAYLTKWLSSQRPTRVSDEPRFPSLITALAGEES